MSRENVEIVRRAAEAAFRKPKPDFDTINELYHHDHELVSLVERLEGGVVEGSRGYRDWIANNDASWEAWETTITQVRRLDADRVMVETVFKAISKRGRVPVEQPVAGVITVRDGKIVRSELFGSRAEALEAAGLSE